MRQLISCLVLPATSPARVLVTLLTTLCGMVPLPNTILPTINIHISSLLLYVLSKYPVPGPPAPFYLILPPNQIYCIFTNILLYIYCIIPLLYLPYLIHFTIPFYVLLPISTTIIFIFLPHTNTMLKLFPEACSSIYTSFFMLSTPKYLLNNNITYCLITKYIVK